MGQRVYSNANVETIFDGLAVDTEIHSHTNGCTFSRMLVLQQLC